MKAERLLNDVLNDLGEFRSETLARTLRQVRRRKQRQRWNRGLQAVACAAVSALVCWRIIRPTVIAPARAPVLVVVHSRPLDPSMIVTTRAGSVNFVASSPSTYALVETGATTGLFKEIDDEGLFALLHGRPAALVRRGPNRVELIFLNPADENGFRLQ